MNKTRVDVDLLHYHHVLVNKPQIEKTDIQCLLDAYREKFQVDLVFAAERLINSHNIELTQISCRDGSRHHAEQKYYGKDVVDENFIRFDEDGLCTYGFPPFDNADENSILHYGIYHDDEYIGSVGILNFHEKRDWSREERLAVQKLGRVLKSDIYMNRITKINVADQDVIDQQNHALKAFFATTDCGILRHTADGNKILSVNKAALQLLDYGSKEEMEQNFDMIAPSVAVEDQAKLRAAIRNLKNVGDCRNVGYQVRHKNGDVLDIMCRVKLLEKDGQLIFQRVLMDCTEQRLHDKKVLLEKETHWNEVVTALSADYSSAFYLDVDTGVGVPYRITNAVKNAFSDTISDETFHAEVLDIYLNRYVHPEDRERFSAAVSLGTIRNKLRDKAFYYVTYRIIKNNVTEYFQAKIVRVGSWEKHHGVMVGFRSIDEKVRKDLEQKQKMEDALKQAEQASRAKTSFLSNMSHDIRTPMNAIIGYTSLAKNHLEEINRVRDYLDKISTSSSHLLSLINDVLDMGRIESGKFSLENAACSLREIMEDLETVMSGQIQDKQLHFRMDMKDIREEAVLCDRLRLNQILINILGNAVKFTPAGGTIAVLLRQKEEECRKGYAGYQFRIKDNGIGMSEEFQKHLFEQFSRENSSTVNGIQGTGLGMVITKSIVDMMGGTISVQSRPGEGTEFVIDLEFPVLEMCGSKSEPKLEAFEARTLSKIKKLLLVEDNALNQEIAAELLTDCGFDVEIADNGSEAVSMLEHSEPGCYDAVLMDIQMPVMNGYEASQKIRKFENEQLAGIPIIAMTANAFDEDRKKAMEAGMNDFVTKPIDIDKLWKALSRINEDLR